MIKNVDVSALVELDKTIPVVDVRTPSEFEQGHICGAYNIPLFSNEERIQVGTTYKQIGREQAILLGFDLTGNKWSGFIRQALQIAPDKKIAVHCWRGGMRSGAMAWALNLYGFDVYLLQGGYKKYREWIRGAFVKNYRLQILGGLTGSGKTKILQLLKQKGEQVVDLEDIAQHQGSTFGSMNYLVQPTQEQFENNLGTQLAKLNQDEVIWLEDESITIGKMIIPNTLWRQMRDCKVIAINVPLEVRVAFLVNEYGVLNKDFLKDCTLKIGKRLGPLQTKNALIAIEEDRMDDFIRLVLTYYDKTYRNGLNKRGDDNIILVDCANKSNEEIADLLITEFKQV